MSGKDFIGCSSLNNINAGSSYLTNQALRRMRYLHTSIATQQWRASRVKDSKDLNIKKCLADLNPRAQAFAISLGPVKVSPNSPPSLVKCEPCVYSTREPRVTTSRDYSSRVASSCESRSRGNPSCNRCHNGIHKDQSRYTGTSGVHCVNLGTLNGDRFSVIPHGSFIPRRRILTQKPSQRRCKWTENLDLPLDELRLAHIETGSGKSPEVSKTLPAIALTKSEQVYTNVRQTLDVKHVRLKTPPPLSSVRHINVRLPAS